MSKQLAQKNWMPAVAIVAIALVAVAALAGSSHWRAQRNSNGRVSAASQVPAVDAAQRGRFRANLDALPLAFEANQGQTNPQVKYMARGNRYTAFLTAEETIFSVQSSSHPNPQITKAAGLASSKSHTTTAAATAAIHMKLVGANPQAQITADNELPGHSNYFIGNDPSKWQSGVKQYARISYREVYPGVNLAFHGQQRQLEFDFIVAPGANAGSIHFDISGAKRISTDPIGNLVLSSPAGDVVLHKPVTYQTKNNAQEPIESRFVVAKNTVSFEVGNYDRSRELVIDPSVSYATFLGGGAEDDAYGIAIDSNGNAYVTGQTTSTDFPVIAGGVSGTNKGSFDVFVSKLSSDGTTLDYSTYVGGSGSDSGNAIAVDGSGNAFVAGGTASNSGFPVTSSALQKTYGGGAVDAFVFELSSSGGTLTYCTYLGGSGDDFASGIALAKDSSGDVFVVGSTGSTAFPGTSSSGIQPTLGGGGPNGFVTKLNSTGNAVIYSTYLGGANDFASAVAVDSSNQAYVTGATQNATFPVTTANAFQKNCGTAANCNGGLPDAFISVVNAAGTSPLVYSTFLGGSGIDQGRGIALDSSGNIYVTGLTQSSGFPVKSSLQTFKGTQDAFVTELSFTSSSSALVYSTLLGGSVVSGGTGIAVDSNKNAYVTGNTSSSDFPKTTNATQPTLKGGNDAFVTEVSASGASLAFSTFLGGSQNENTNTGGGNLAVLGAIAVDSAGANIYVAGNTVSPDFPATAGVIQGTYHTGTDAFVAKYSTATTSANFTITNGALSPASGSPGVSASSTITVTSTNSFNSAVALTCSVSPVVSKGPSCSLSNPSVTPPANSTATSTLNVATTSASARLEGPMDRHNLFFATILPIFGVTLFGAGIGSSDSRRKRLFGLLILSIVMMSLLLMPACSSSSSTVGGTTGTPAGSYTITVTGTSGGATATGTPALTLTVN